MYYYDDLHHNNCGFICGDFWKFWFFYYFVYFNNYVLYDVCGGLLFYLLYVLNVSFYYYDVLCDEFDDSLLFIF